MERLRSALETLGVNVSRETLDKFENYMDMVLQWNEHVNLTAITQRDDFIVKHFIDSILCVNFSQYEKAQSVIDVGTGAGFPGIPLAILSPEKDFLLMDSLNKRIKILDEINTKLELKNVRLLHSRAEEAATTAEHREKYDICVSRAVARLSTLSEYCLPFVKVGGCFLAYKGTDYEKELQEGKKAVAILGGQVEEVKDIKMEGFDLEHKIICIKKVKNTNTKYPRKAGTPSKEPL